MCALGAHVIELQLRCILHTCTITLALACWTAVIIAIIVNLMACLCREILPCKKQENTVKTV